MLGVHGKALLALLRVRAGNAFDLRRGAAGLFGDLAILLDQEAVRRLVAGGVLLLMFVPPRAPEPALALLAAWLGFFGLGWYGPWVAYLAETAPVDKVGLTLGAAMALNQLGIIAAPPLLGLVHDLTGGYAALWACVVAMLALAYGLTARRSA